MAQHFHSLEIREVIRETPDCISVGFIVPDVLRETFAYHAGQYVTLRAEVGDRELRRSYSLCSAPHENQWRVAIKRVDGGMFSQWAHMLLRAGDSIDVLPPDGHFVYESQPHRARRILLLAAGSGITPVYSILKTALETEAHSQVTLVFGNRRVNDIIFREQIEDLRDQHLARFQLIHTLSGEVQESPMANGRIDGEKIARVIPALINAQAIDELYICGPGAMIESAARACLGAGVPEERIHKELFGVPGTKISQETHVSNAPDTDTVDGAWVSVIADGIEREMRVGFKGDSVLDVVLASGIDVPYACKAGVCCTCRARVLEGELRMDANYTLEQHEVDRGFVLTCQAHPVTDRVRLSFDSR
jgi:ring-1,2-phenylacetyl-CoA epoxidase subunit PaaE